MTSPKDDPSEPNIDNPSEPSDLPNHGKFGTFKDALLGKANNLTQTYELPKQIQIDIEKENQDPPDTIQLSYEDLHRIYQP